MQSLASVASIGWDGYLLIKEVSDLWQEVKNYCTNETLNSRDRLRVALKSLAVASRCFLVFHHFYGCGLQRQLNLSDLTPEQTATIKQALSHAVNRQLTARAVLLFDKVIRESWNTRKFFTMEIVFEAISLTNTGLHANELISDRTYEAIGLGAVVVPGSFKVFSFWKEPEQLRIIQDVCLCAYDRLFPTYQLSNIPLQTTDGKELQNLEIDHLAYQAIPEEHKRNRVFRHFKCSLTCVPIRYPVIVVDDDYQPIQPIKLFERKTLLIYLTINSLYPGTDRQINLNQVKEHLGVRRLIEEELNRLGLNTQINSGLD